MTGLLKIFGQILLLRASPGELPYSQALMTQLLVAHLMVGALLAYVTPPGDEALLTAALGTLSLYGVSWLLLSLYSLTPRIAQVVSALAGCEIAIGLLSLPIYGWFFSVSKEAQALPALLLIMLFGWNVALAAHIYRQAVGVSWGMGLLYALAYIISSVALLSLI